MRMIAQLLLRTASMMFTKISVAAWKSLVWNRNLNGGVASTSSSLCRNPLAKSIEASYVYETKASNSLFLFKFSSFLNNHFLHLILSGRNGNTIMARVAQIVLIDTMLLHFGGCDQAPEYLHSEVSFPIIVSPSSH